MGSEDENGPGLQSPVGMAIESPRTLLVVDETAEDDYPVLLRVDLVTGTRTIVSFRDPSTEVGTGPVFDEPAAVAVELDGMILVSGDREIVRVESRFR